MTKDEFVEMLSIMWMRTSANEVVGYRRAEDVPTRPLTDGEHDADMDNWGSLCVKAFGRLWVDDHDEPVRRETDQYGHLTSLTSMWALDEIHTDKWPEGLFEKLRSYTWWVDPRDEINLLDVIVAQVGIKE